MSRKKAKLGDLVIHHGFPHEITRVGERATMRDGQAVGISTVHFENSSFASECVAEELEWSEGDGAWYLPGRLLSRNERCLAEAVLGSYPPASSHLAVRQALAGVDLATVDRDRYGRVLARRKRDIERNESGEVDPEVLETYTAAALTQCEAIRSANQGEG
jgi:hypothetical protein